MSNVIIKACDRCGKEFNVFVFWREIKETCTACILAEQEALKAKNKLKPGEIHLPDPFQNKVAEVRTEIEMPKTEKTKVVGIDSEAIIYKIRPIPKVSKRLSRKYGDINKLSQKVLDRYKKV